MITEEPKPVFQRPISRRQILQRQRQKRIKLGTVIAGVVLALMILSIPAYGYYQQFVAPGLEVIVRVNDTTINTNQYLKLLKVRVALQDKPDYSTEPLQLVQDLVNQELIRQGAPRLNLFVSDQELTQELKNRAFGDQKPDEGLSETDKESQFKTAYAAQLRKLGLTDQEYRRIVSIELLREKLRDKLGQQIPAVAEQVHARAMVLDNSADADKAAARLKAGEKFENLNKELSTDSDLKGKDGDLGWMPKGIMGSEFDNAVFQLAPKAIANPVPLTGGYYVIEVLEKSNAMEISKDNLEKLKDAALNNWLEEEEKQNKVERIFNSDKYSWAVERIQEMQPKSPQSQDGYPQ